MVIGRSYKNAADIIEARYGVRVTSRDNPLLTQAGVAAARVFDNNPRRLAWVIINLSANNIYVALTPDVATTKGIFIAPNGGFLGVTIEDDFDLPSREWWIIAGGAGSAIYSLSLEIYS